MTQAALRLRLGGADQEERLARAAAAGNGRAFSTLYARYEEPVFSLAFRLTGSADLAARAAHGAFADALDAMSHLKEGGAPFGSCLLIATRNHSIEVLPDEAQSDDEPEHEDEAEQHYLREAVLSLDGADREVLALGAIAGLPRGGIATIMDVDGEAVPELTAAARLGLHEQLWGPDPDLEDPPEECAQALPLMALRDDGHLDDGEDRAWLVEHLAHCAECRLRLDAMEQAQAAYGRWAPPAPPPSLLGEVTAATGRFADDEPKRSQRAGGAPALATATGAATSTLATAGSAAASTLASARAGASRLGSSVWQRRPWSDRLVTAGLILTILLGLSATLAGATLVLRGEDPAEPTAPQADEADTPTTAPPRVVKPPKSEPAAKAARKRKKARPDSREGGFRVVRPPAELRIAEKPQVRQTPQRVVPRAEAVPLPKTTPAPRTPEPTPAPPPAEPAPQPPSPQPAPVAPTDQ